MRCRLGVLIACHLIPLGIHALLEGYIVTAVNIPLRRIGIVGTGRRAKQQAGTGAHSGPLAPADRRANHRTNDRTDGCGTDGCVIGRLRRVLDRLLGILPTAPFLGGKNLKRFAGGGHYW